MGKLSNIIEQVLALLLVYRKNKNAAVFISCQFETTTYHYIQGEVQYETVSSDPARVIRARADLKGTSRSI